MKANDDNSLSSASNEHCEGCGKFKICKMYVLPNLTSAWICKECREGKK